MLPLLQTYPTVILAHGDYPVHPVPLKALHDAQRIICCDGVAQQLLHEGLQPAAIVGDMDSLPLPLQRQWASLIHHSAEQETNDLTKAFDYCTQQGYKRIALLGVTGKREDHTLGNISLLAQYAQKAELQLLTDYGVFVAIERTTSFESFAGQQVSLFSLDNTTKITTHQLKYPIRNGSLLQWWQGTLNEAQGNSFTVEIDKGSLLVWRTYPMALN
jgi:thiamine pyrophosphokinase